jgi:hypothetical protein
MIGRKSRLGYGEHLADGKIHQPQFVTLLGWKYIEDVFYCTVLCRMNKVVRSMYLDKPNRGRVGGTFRRWRGIIKCTDQDATTHNKIISVSNFHDSLNNIESSSHSPHSRRNAASSLGYQAVY